MTTEPADVEYSDVEDLVALAARLLGHPPPIRDLGLLGSAAARPDGGAVGEDARRGIWLTPAALAQLLVEDQPLVNGD